MVVNVRAEPVNRKRPHIAAYPLLRDAVDRSFPVLITYGDKDIYGKSRRHVRNRFPHATIMEIVNAVH
jgi:proline iminopeptidase